MDPESPEDPWLTIAEISAELRCSPATIRSWISKGTLPAMRPGQRKLLVKRSALDRMLKGGGATNSPGPPPEAPADVASSARGPVPDSVSSVTWSAEDRAAVEPEDWLGVAQWEWLGALRGSQMAPPDAWFIGRLTHLAEAAARKADALTHFDDEATLHWEVEPGGDELTLSYELRPGGNRPGPSELWARFDTAVKHLGRALLEGRAATLREALADLSIALHDIADALGHLRGVSGDWRGASSGGDATK